MSDRLSSKEAYELLGITMAPIFHPQPASAPPPSRSPVQTQPAPPGYYTSPMPITPTKPIQSLADVTNYLAVASSNSDAVAQMIPQISQTNAAQFQDSTQAILQHVNIVRSQLMQCLQWLQSHPHG